MVSIHAPAWGATAAAAVGVFYLYGFNPRARMGRDIRFKFFYLVNHRFNPRARMGRDSPRRNNSSTMKVVSIHAPAWGATRLALLLASLGYCFNPRARMGRDLGY